MALQCRIVLNENNEIDYVKTEDGQRSQLFDGLVETLGGDKNSALGFYALTESEDFKTIQKNERLSQTKKQESNRGGEIATRAANFLRSKGGTNEKNSSWRQKQELEAFAKDNMIGMFKYDKNAKNTAQVVQEARIQKGGVKLDNYDGYLTKLYQKNGFRVAARLPFNKEFAPEDWSEEMHGTPDVVFMVYDPQNKLKIEEKTFEDYDEASAYRESFVEEAKVLKEFKNNVGDLTSEFTDETSLTKPRPLVEPSVEEVVQYANATEEELTPEQTIDLQDVIMSLGVNNSKEAEKKLKEALETKGFIRFNKKQMLNSGAFNKYEVKQILNSKEKQDQVEQSYRALKNSPTIEVEYPKDFVYNTSEINSFGKQKVLNPFILQQDIIKQGKIPEGVLIEQQTQQKEVRVQTKAKEIIKVEVTPEQTITEQQDFKELTKIELPSPKFLTVSQLSKAVNSEKMIELKNKQEELRKRWKELDEISNCIWKS